MANWGVSDPLRLPPISVPRSETRGSLTPHLVRRNETARRAVNQSSRSGEPTSMIDHPQRVVASAASASSSRSRASDHARALARVDLSSSCFGTTSHSLCQSYGPTHVRIGPDDQCITVDSIVPGPHDHVVRGR